MATKNEQLRDTMQEAGLDPNASYKPGLSGMGSIGSVYTSESGVALGDSGKQLGYIVEKSDDPNEYRIGDYTYTGTGYQLVPNSPTDIVQNYVTSDAKSRQGLSITDWFNAASKATMGFMGLPTNDFTGNSALDLAGMAATAGIGQIMKGNPATRLAWAAGNFLSSLNDADQKYLDEYLNQDFGYELAGQFKTGEDGKMTFEPEYKKMADAGPESGKAVIAAQDTDHTQVSINGDNNLTIRVSPVFAESDSYKNLLKGIKDNVPNLSVDSANEVVDQDTGETRLQVVENMVKSAESNYLYNVQTVKNIKAKAPVASDKALDIGVEVSKVGYQKEAVLKETTIQIYNDRNELQEVNAKEWLDSVASMDKVGRENYMLSLGNRIADSNISDDEKAVLYGQSIALYAASDNDGDYKGMYNKDFWDAIGSSSEVFSGLSWNQLFGGTELTTFRENELAAGLLRLSTTVASVKALSAATNALEKGMRKITPGLSKWAGDGGVKGAAQGTEHGASNAKYLATIAGKTATQLGYQVAADAMYDAAKIIPYATSGNIDQYDFLRELETDFAMDMLVTYGPGQFVQSMNSPKFEYRVLVEDTKTGDFEYKRLSDIKDSTDYKILEDEIGTRDAKLVEVTADEIASRRAAVIDKLTDSKVGLKVQELLFDKNAAMQKLAVQVRKVSDTYHYRKIMRYGNDIRQLTADTLRDFLANNTVSKNWDNLGKTLKETGETLGKITKADWNYIKAVTNEYRFLEKQEGDKGGEKIVRDFYKGAKNGVSAERAEQLNKVMGAMRAVASNVLDYYVEKGVMAQEDVNKLRNAPGYTNGMYLPMYVTGGVKAGGIISQDRSLYKRVKNPDALIKLDDIDNPMNSLARYVNNAMRAIAINDKALAIREAASMAGVGIRVSSDSGEVLKEVKNLRAMNEKFDKIFKGIAAKTRSSLPTFKQWQEANDKLVLRSNAYKSAQKLGQLQEEGKELRKQLRNARRSQKKELFANERLSDDIKRNTFSPTGTYRSDRGSRQRYKWYAFGPNAEASAKTYGKDVKEYDISDKIVLDATSTDGAGVLYDILSRAKDKELNELAEKFLQMPFGEDRVVIDGDVLKQTQGAPVEKIFDELAKYGIDGFALNTRGLEELVVDTKDTPSKRKIVDKVSSLQSKIQENKQAQLKTTDDIKRYIGLVMDRAQKAHKGSPTKLDIQSYLDVNATNALKSALKSGNMVGEVQKVINQAVEAANPWVDPEPIIRERTQRAAEKFRVQVAKDMASQKKTLGDKFNMAVDRVMDNILEKVTGEREAEVTYINDNGEPTTMLTNHGQKNVIRYMLDGEVQEMRLSGNGAEQLVEEFYAPDFVAPKTTLGKVANRIADLGNRIAQGKRYLTTSIDIARVAPNFARDWSRGIATTGGQILMSPDKFFNDLANTYGYTEKQTKQIQDGLMLARGAVDESTLTASLQMPRKNRPKNMVRAMTEPDGNAFTRFVYDLKAFDIGKIMSRPQDTVEMFTRKRAMDTAYFKELSDAQARGLSLDESIKRATEAAYFYGREATVNFYRRGTLIAKIAQQVPYLSQRFASLESFVNTYLDNPIGVARSLETTVSAYASLIAIALSNEESRQKYYMLTEYDRANNIIIPIDNGAIMTMPLDETIAAFLTPYRRMIETLNGVDPEAFYLCFAEGLEALSPIDLSGFSEGDGFNIQRGFEKMGAEFIPTWAQPFVEMATGRDLYYGSAIAIDSDYTGALYDNWTPTPGELTTQGKNSQALKAVADHTGIPQWILQNFLAEYGGNIGQYVLNTIDKLGGATEEAQGGKEWSTAVFKPFTGSDSDQVKSAFYDAVNELKNEKKKVQNEIATLTQQIKGVAGQEKADLINKRQEKINNYGIKVSDVLNQYLSAYQIAGGLSKSQANQAWYLYKLYDDNFNSEMYLEGTSGDFYTDKAKSYSNKQATMLAGASGIDGLFRNPSADYEDSYAYQAFKNTVYGYGTEQMSELANILENKDNYEESFTKLRSDVKKARSDAYSREDYTTMSALAYNYDKQIANAIYPYLLQHGVAETLNKSAVMDYLKEWFIVPSEEMKTSTGRYVPNLGTDAEKSEAFKKQFIKKIFGVSGQ